MVTHSNTGSEFGFGVGARDYDQDVDTNDEIYRSNSTKTTNHSTSKLQSLNFRANPFLHVRKA
jgi:hypothetical protein